MRVGLVSEVRGSGAKTDAARVTQQRLPAIMRSLAPAMSTATALGDDWLAAPQASTLQIIKFEKPAQRSAFAEQVSDRIFAEHREESGHCLG